MRFCPYRAEDLEEVRSPPRSPKTKGKCDQAVLSGPTEHDNGDLDCRCSYEVECDRRIAKIKELMKPMEQAALSL